MIINELLCYTFHHVNSGTFDNIKRILYNFYDDTEVVAAKRVLWDVCKDDLGPWEDRRGSDARTAKHAHIEDIMAAAKKLDAKEKLPDIVAKNLDKVPDRQPEELNYIMLIQRVAQLEKCKADNDEILSRMAIDILNLQEQNHSDKGTQKPNNMAGNKDGNNNTPSTSNIGQQQQDLAIMQVA